MLDQSPGTQTGRSRILNTGRSHRHAAAAHRTAPRCQYPTSTTLNITKLPKCPAPRTLLYAPAAKTNRPFDWRRDLIDESRDLIGGERSFARAHSAAAPLKVPTCQLAARPSLRSPG